MNDQLPITLLERFEAAWQGGLPPDLASFVTEEEGHLARESLIELVKIDLERRWRLAFSTSGELSDLLAPTQPVGPFPSQPRLDDYARQHGALGPASEWPLSLIAEEYRVRRRWGDQPVHDAYLRRFADRDTAALTCLLLEIDRQLAADGSRPAPRSSSPGLPREPSLLDTSPVTPRSRVDTPPTHPAAKTAQPAPVRRFGEYDLIEEVARGGIGVVYKARQRGLNRVVALKMLLSGQHADPDEIKRFRVEAEAAARLDHPRIVPIFEVGEHDGRHFFSMGFVEGQSLARRILDGLFAPREAAEMLLKIAEAVEYAHQQGIIHRDLKPSNILLDKAGEPRVTDFGLAKQVRSDSNLTTTGEILGTPSFMPPEQALGKLNEIGPLADVYSLGAILYALLTGNPPFKAGSIPETLRLVVEHDPVSPRKAHPEVPRDLETICLKCLEKRPDKRYASAQHLVEDLRRFLAGEALLARPAGPLERAWKWCRRRPLAAALAASLVIVAIVSAGAVVGYRQAQEARLERDRINQLAALQSEFDAKIDHPALGGDYLVQVETLAARIDALDVPRGQEIRQRFARRYGEYLKEVIHQPRLSDAEGQAVQATLEHAQFQRVGASLAAALLADLKRTWRQLTPVIQLAPPYTNIAEVFLPTVVVAENGSLRCIPKIREDGRIGVVLTTAKSAGDIEYDAVFRGPWHKARVLALGIDRRPKASSTGYHFIVHPVVTDEALGKAKADGGLRFEHSEQVILEIRSDKDTLSRRRLALADLGSADSIRLHVAREGNHLTLQVNDLPALEADELFHMETVQDGVFTVYDMRGPGLDQFLLSELTARSRQSAGESSPLAQGDSLFTQGEYAQALEQYRLQTRTTTSAVFRNESRFKEGLCLAALKRQTEAQEIFAELVAAADQRWSAQAACQMWLLYLEAGQLQEADAVMVHLSATHRFETLAAMVPTATLDRIMERLLDKAQASKQDAQLLVANLERLVNSLELLGATSERIYSARLDLRTANELAGNTRRVYEVAARLMADQHDRLTSINDIPFDYVRLAMKYGEADQALRTIDGLLFDQKTGEVILERQSLLVERAALFAARGNWQQVQSDLQKLQDRREAARQAESRIWTRYVDASLQASILLGIAHEQLGDQEAALREWKQGFQFAREQRFPDYDCWLSGILGSLSGELNEDDVVIMLGQLTAGLPTALVVAVSNRVVPVALLTSVIRNLWHTPQGRAALREHLWGQSLQTDATGKLVEAMLLEIGREMVMGIAEQSPTMTPDQEAMLQQAARDLMLALDNNQLGANQAVQTMLAYNGNRGLFGWASLRPTLPEGLRGVGAYILGYKGWREKNQEAYKFYLAELDGELAKADLNLEINARLKRLVDELRNLPPASEPAP